jgi:hypothetical protein
MVKPILQVLRSVWYRYCRLDYLLGPQASPRSPNITIQYRSSIRTSLELFVPHRNREYVDDNILQKMRKQDENKPACGRLLLQSVAE